MSPKEFYPGFWLEQPVGNNAFSFAQRQNKKIYVAPLISAPVEKLKPGSRIAFSEIEDGEERNINGLEHFLQFSFNGKSVYIFDNHNHAFFFWLLGYTQDLIQKDSLLVHVDQHTDMREPENYPDFSGSEVGLEQIFHYTNYVLNVGNFIKPAMKLGLFSQTEIIDSQPGFKKEFPAGYVLDLDMDIFSDEMAYIDEGYKISRIKDYIAGAAFITVATSPYFMQQEKAIKILQELFKE